MREYARYEEQNWEPARSYPGRTAGSAIVWLLVGMGIGAGAAMLLTPTNGRELRGAMARGYRRTVDGLSRGAHELRQRGSKLLTFNRSRLEQKRSQQG